MFRTVSVLSRMAFSAWLATELIICAIVVSECSSVAVSACQQTDGYSFAILKCLCLCRRRAYAPASNTVTIFELRKAIDGFVWVWASAWPRRAAGAPQILNRIFKQLAPVFF